MNVNDILNKALKLLGIGDLTVSGTNTDPRLTVLVNALGVTYMQLITEYAPLEKEETVCIADHEADTSALTSTVFDIVRLTDESGEGVKCRLRGGKIIAERDGNFSLTYYYLPTSYPAIGGTLTVTQQITEEIIARGVAAEYALESMLYEEAIMHEKKYKEGLRNVLSPHRSVRVDMKRWL